MEQQYNNSSRVSTAGIARRNNKFLVALRKPGTSIGEAWEFPGGKKEHNETPEQALKREFIEEFSVNILVGEKLCTEGFVNRDQPYVLEVYSVRLITDSFVLTEHQEIRWMTLHDLKHVPMANSDKKIVYCLEKMYSSGDGN